MATVDGAMQRPFWWIHSSIGVTEQSIGEILDNVQRVTPGADIAIKAFNGGKWQGKVEAHPRQGISIFDGTDLDNWIHACQIRDMTCHVWGVVTEPSVRQADIIHAIANKRQEGMGKIILDVEPYEYYYYDRNVGKPYTRRETEGLCKRLRYVEKDRLALCYDYRWPRDIHFKLWRDICGHLMPMVYTGSFRALPEDVVPFVVGHIREHSLDHITVAPVLQTYIEPDDYDPDDICHTAELLLSEYPMMQFSFFRYSPGDKEVMDAAWSFMREYFPVLPEVDKGNETRNYISLTQVNSAAACQRKWQYTYVEGIERSTLEEGPRTTGQLVHTGLHKALEFLYYCDDVGREPAIDHAREAMTRWLADSGEQVEFVDLEGSIEPIEDHTKRLVDSSADIVARALDALGVPEKYEVIPVPGTEVPFLEQHLKVKLPFKHYGVQGIVDALVRNKEDGTIALLDWKIRSKFQSHDIEVMIPQLAIYQYMVRLLYDIDTHLGIVFNVKSVPPKSPMYNKGGAPNKNYLKYEWSRPVYLYRSPEIQSEMWQNLMYQVLDIDGLHGKHVGMGALPMSLGWQCGHCEFRNLCYAELFGQDVKHVRDNMYMPRRKRGMNETKSQAG